VASRVEAELALDKFMDHLRAWLVQQPQWAMLMGAADRRTRREVADLIAKEITTIPTAAYDPGTPNRALRRAILKVLERDDARVFEGIDL
jgi:hypothetical protein